MNHPIRVTVAAVLFMLTGSLLASSPADAHSGNQSYVYLEIFDTAIAGRVEYPIKDLNSVLGLDIPLGTPETLDAVTANAAQIETYTRAHLLLGPADSATTWSYEFGDINVLDLDARSYVVFEFEVDERFDPPPRTFTMTYDAIIEADRDRSALLLIATDWNSGTFNNERSELVRFSAGDTTQVVTLDDASWFKGMTGVIDLGADHIRIGTDHILFIFALVLPSVLVFIRWHDEKQARWHPTARFGSSLWRVLKIVTMFTVAHSITLALGGLGVIELPPRLVETIIVLSIAAAALHNLHPIFTNKEWLLAFGFGLFHGFGFAGLLADLGLDRSNRIPSLLGFNIGVELGQGAIILMVFPVLFILRRTTLYLPILHVASIALAVVATAWAAERIFGVDTRVDELVGPILYWPRSALLVGAGYVFATAIWAVERSRGRLRPVVDSDLAEQTDPPARELVDV